MKKIVIATIAASIISAPAMATELSSKLDAAAGKVYGAINTFDSTFLGTDSNAAGIDGAFASLAHEIGNYNSYITVMLDSGTDGGWVFNPETLTLDYVGATDPSYGNVTNTEVNDASVTAEADKVIIEARKAILGGAYENTIVNGDIQDYADAAANGAAGAMLQAVATSVHDATEAVDHFKAGTGDITLQNVKDRFATFQMNVNTFNDASEAAKNVLDAGDTYAFNGLDSASTGTDGGAAWGYGEVDHKEFVDNFDVTDYDFSNYYTAQ